MKVLRTAAVVIGAVAMVAGAVATFGGSLGLSAAVMATAQTVAVVGAVASAKLTSCRESACFPATRLDNRSSA